MKTNIIHNMECAEGMKQIIPNESIDLVVTSPPYDNLRSYNGYSFNFEEIAKELWRVIKPGGVVVWVVGDATVKGSETGTSFRQALYFKDLGFNLHDTMIFEKATPAPQAQHPRYQPCFEYMFVFCKGKSPKTFNPIKVKTVRSGRIEKTNGQRNGDNTYRHSETKEMRIKEYKLKKNIWSYANERREDYLKKHPAPFPEKLAEDHIISWSNPGDIVLDPFMGSGTTAKMAILNDRRYIGFEMSAEYCAIAEERLSKIQTALV